MIVGGDEQLAGRSRKKRRGAQEIARTRIRQVEVKPKRVARLLGDRMIDRKLLRGPVRF
jgi:hypothetical protein